MKKVRKAIIPAAGLGTRFLPATKAMPKEMLPVLDKPTIQYIVEEAVAAGIEDIIIVTGKHKRAIEDHFDHQVELEQSLKEKGKLDILKKVESSTNLANIFYIRQKKQKGLGHALLTAKQFIGDEPFAVLLGDDIVESEVPSIKQLLESYNKYEKSIIGVQEVSEADVSKYGIVEYSIKKDNLYSLSHLYEKPSIEETNSRMAIMGRYILTPDIFNELEKEKIGSGGEIQLTDALAELNKNNPIYAYEFKGKRYDVGNKLGLIKASIDFALKSDIQDELRTYMKDKL